MASPFFWPSFGPRPLQLLPRSSALQCTTGAAANLPIHAPERVRAHAFGCARLRKGVLPELDRREGVCEVRLAGGLRQGLPTHRKREFRVLGF